MSPRAADAGRRMCYGTWMLLEAWGHWLSAASHADRPGLVRLGVTGRRLAGSLFAVVFYGSILQRAPYLIYAVPVAWAWAAWQMSELRATPPPETVPPSGDVLAGETDEIARVVRGPEGVTCTIHPVREETPANPK